MKFVVLSFIADQDFSSIFQKLVLGPSTGTPRAATNSSSWISQCFLVRCSPDSIPITIVPIKQRARKDTRT